MRILFTGFALSLTLLSGCSVRTYFADRGRDLADVVTISTGTGFGARAQIGPLALAPAIMQSDSVGLRGGEFFSIDLADANVEYPPVDGGALWWGSSAFYLEDNQRQQERGKAVFAFPVPESPQDMSFTVFSANVPFVNVPRTNWQAEELNLSRYPAHYWTQIEVVLALMGSLRLGANPGELVDFVLGWFPYGDIYRDDVGRLRRHPVTPPAVKTTVAERPSVKKEQLEADMTSVPTAVSVKEEPPPMEKTEEKTVVTGPWWKRYPKNIKVFLVGEETPINPMTSEEIEEAKRKPETREQTARRKRAEQERLKLDRSLGSQPGGLGL